MPQIFQLDPSRQPVEPERASLFLQLPSVFSLAPSEQEEEDGVNVLGYGSYNKR